MTDPSTVLSNVPQRGHVDGSNGDVYDYAVQSTKRGTLTLSVNKEQFNEINYDEAPEDFKKILEKPINEIVALDYITQTLGHPVPSDETKHYLTAWRLLHTEGNTFFKFCVDIISEYHALDFELVQTLLLGMTRARYSSVSALAHFDATGASGAGKNDLVNRVVALIPPRYVDVFSTTSPTALYYETIERRENSRGKSVKVTNPDRFKGKIVCITEVADSAGHAALKALAETEEDAASTHAATVNGENVKMTIRGARCIVVTSVDGINDAQVKRRFIHTSVSDDDEINKGKKLNVAQELMFNEQDIQDDPRLPVARAGIDFIFSTDGVVLEDLEPEAKQLIKTLNKDFIKAGYGITNIKQFFTLCQCSAYWNRFERGHARIEVDDVKAAWFLLANFEKETISKTTRNGVRVLETIRDLCKEYDADFEDGGNPAGLTKPQRPSKNEIVKASKIPQATVYRLLMTRPSETGKLGELFELGYVLNDNRDGHNVIELSDLGASVLRKVPNLVTVEGQNENDKNIEYSPVEPRFFGVETKPVTLEEIVRTYEG
jgi:hypothetical protein